MVDANARRDSARRCGRGLFTALAYGLTALGTMPVGAEFDADLFEKYEIVTGKAKRQTVLPGFFLARDAAEIARDTAEIARDTAEIARDTAEIARDTAEIAVVFIDERRDRRIRMYGFDGVAWASVLEAALGPNVLFVDVANIGGRERLVTYESGRLNWFDPGSATERRLLDVATRYNASDPDAIAHVEITRDINGDGLDDVVLPDIDGFWVSTQSSDGSFAEPVKLGPPEPFRDETALEEKRTYGEVGLTSETNPGYQSRVHEMDYDRDGRRDLVFWNVDHFDVHPQNALGSFDPIPLTFATDVPFDSDGVYSVAFGFIGENVFKLLSGFRKKTRRTVLHSIRDINGDGVADLVTLSLEGRSVLRQRSALEVHYGTPTSNGTVFEREVGTAIAPGKATALGYSLMSLHDSAEGRVDARLGHVGTGAGQLYRVLFANSMAVGLTLYRTEEGVFPDKPTITRNIKPAYHPFGRRGPFFPAVLVGDVSGDGLEDLLVGHSRKELHVYRGVAGPEVFSREPATVAVDMTDNEKDSRLVDLTHDGKKSVLVHYPSTTDPHRVQILISR